MAEPAAPPGRVALAVLISGRGSNMAAIARAAAAPDYPARIVLVAADRRHAPGLEIARTLGLPTTVVPHRDFATRQAFEEALDGVLRAARAELVALAGFLRVLTPWFVGRWRGRILNIHPSLLPRHPGLNPHARAIDAGDSEFGCTVHEVTEGVDAGPILAQARVPVLPDDTPERLAARVLAEEHRLYPLAIADFVRHRLQRAGPREEPPRGALAL